MDHLTDITRERQADELQALTEVTKALVAPRELPELLDAVMRTIARVLQPAEVGAIMLWDHPAGVFRPAAAIGYDLETLKEIGLRAGESITGKVFDAGQARLLAAPDEAARAMADLRPFNREVLATLSHELRMPLSTIKGYATAMLIDELHWSDAQRDQFLQLIEEACDDMEGMLRDILDSSLADVDQLKLEPQPVRLGSLARQVAGELQHRSEQHRLVVDFPQDFPIVSADERWIKQVLRNILDNAVKYSPEGGLIVLRGETRRADVVVSVADQGIGISSEDVIPLFEKYFRVRSVSTLHVPGTGLGLPIARAVVEAHGGRIWVESTVGEGSTILFSLPRDPSVEEAR